MNVFLLLIYVCSRLNLRYIKGAPKCKQVSHCQQQLYITEGIDQVFSRVEYIIL